MIIIVDNYFCTYYGYDIIQVLLLFPLLWCIPVYNNVNASSSLFMFFIFHIILYIMTISNKKGNNEGATLELGKKK